MPWDLKLRMTDRQTDRDIRQATIYERLENAETDRDGFIYLSVNKGLCFFKVDRRAIWKT